jgi:hypothetical protein
MKKKLLKISKLIKLSKFKKTETNGIKALTLNASKDNAIISKKNK